jgi:hypothetical protein
MTFRPKVVRRILVLTGYVGLAALHFRVGTASLLCHVLVLTGCALEFWTEVSASKDQSE